MKKRVAEAMTWVQDQLCSLRGRTALRLGVMIVFITQMLLMMAGDVEPNPGPGEKEKGGRKGRVNLKLLLLLQEILDQMTCVMS